MPNCTYLSLLVPLVWIPIIHRWLPSTLELHAHRIASCTNWSWCVHDCLGRRLNIYTLGIVPGTRLDEQCPRTSNDKVMCALLTSYIRPVKLLDDILLEWRHEYLTTPQEGIKRIDVIEQLWCSLCVRPLIEVNYAIIVLSVTLHPRIVVTISRIDTTPIVNI